MVGCLAFSKSYAISINVTKSLPGSIFLIEKQPKADLKIGELAAFAYSGKAFYRPGSVFVKIVQGKAGSVVKAKKVEQGIYDYFVDQVFVGRTKLFSQSGVPIRRATTGIIPKDHFYMFGTHPDSLDSRYEVVGLVSQSQIIGRAHRVF